MSFNIRLKEARVSKGLKQKDFADKIGVSPSTVNGYEKGTSHPKEDIMYRIFEALEVEPNYLFQDSFIKNEVERSSTTSNEQKLLENYRSLNDEGKEKVEDYIDDLVQSNKYKKDYSFELGEEEAN